MRLATICLVFLIAFSAEKTAAGAAPNCCAYPVLPTHASALADFVPSGWRIEIEGRGALNGDSRTAVAFVLRSTNAAYVTKLSNTNPRILAVAFTNPDGSYELALQNHTLIPRPTDTRDFDYELGNASKGNEQKGLSFKRGMLRVAINENIYVGPSAGVYRTFTFRYRGARFELVGYDSTGIGTSNEEIVDSYNFLTRRKNTAKGEGCVGNLEDIQKYCQYKTVWTDIPNGPLLTLDNIGSGLEFSPQT